MGLVEEFNSWQTGYTDKIRRWVPEYAHLIGSVVDGLPAGFAPVTVLDLGCGNGNGTALLSSHFPEAVVTLLDASDEMLAACRERFQHQSNFHYVASYFQEAVFAKNSFDEVMAVLALHHVPGVIKRAVFNQIFDWLKPGGIFIYADLFATKEDPAYQETVLKEWHAWATQHGTPAEEWEYLMDHHEKYDFPDAPDQTLSWLEASGFSSAEFMGKWGYWGTIKAIKPL